MSGLVFTSSRFELTIPAEVGTVLRALAAGGLIALLPVLRRMPRRADASRAPWNRQVQRQTCG